DGGGEGQKTTEKDQKITERDTKDPKTTDQATLAISATSATSAISATSATSTTLATSATSTTASTTPTDREEELAYFLKGRREGAKRLEMKKEMKKRIRALQKWIDVEVKPIKEYSNILAMKKIGDNQLLIVERPVLDIVANLPKVVYRRRYGI
ncbi:hypothetical protein WA538_004675, partial [Blastocystis sp. DL]